MYGCKLTVPNIVRTLATCALSLYLQTLIPMLHLYIFTLVLNMLIPMVRLYICTSLPGC